MFVVVWKEVGGYRFARGAILTLAYQSLGVVYGDLSTFPLYVYKTTFSRKLSLHEHDVEVFGVLSFIFWTLTIIPLFKYIFFVLSADDNGEGGTFALYSLLCRHAKLSMLPNQQIIDENLSTYGTSRTVDTRHGHFLKEFFNKNLRSQNWLLTFVLFGTCMAIGDGVLTPTISVLSAMSGVRVKITHLHENYVIVISCIILVGFFCFNILGHITFPSYLHQLLHFGLSPLAALVFTIYRDGIEGYSMPFLKYTWLDSCRQLALKARYH